ncbi:hypothetical protein SOVF_190060 [Spinacia oleracea]|nr:hypothetical protein SOVF_190060 [Spinacia oleracea]
MGNYCCVIHGSSAVAVWSEDDDWGTESAVETEGLLGGCVESSSSHAVETTGNQVRIRISKRELEEVLRRVDANKSGTKIKKMKAQQVLQNLIDKSDHFEIHNQRPWTPALQSIPEVN